MKLSDDEEYDEEYEDYEDDEEERKNQEVFLLLKKKEPEVEEESSNSKISQPFDNTITASREAKKRRFTSTGSKVVSMNGRGVEVYEKATGFCRSTDGSRSFKRRKQQL